MGINISLQHKILFGYLTLMAVIISMAAILFHEYARMRRIESEAAEISRIRHDISTIHQGITVLASLGESVIAREEWDYRSYHTRRLRVDSLLRMLQTGRNGIVDVSQIGLLRELLTNKEEYLSRIIQVLRCQDRADSLLAAVSQATPRSPERLHLLDERLTRLQTERLRHVDDLADSLRAGNKEVNRRLCSLLESIDGNMQAVFLRREEHIAKSYKRSIVTVTALIAAAAALLFISCLIIRHDLRLKTRNKKKMEGIIARNHELLETSKHIILTISHDIRAPLNIINGSAELAMDTRDRKRRNIYLSNIGPVCRHVLHLLNNLLDVYRLNESKETCNNVPFNLKLLLERIASGFSHVVNNKGILFRSDFHGIDHTLYGDADRIEQILDNLLTNAVKFTESGTITFHADYGNGRLTLQIKDTGIGMSEDALSRIFRPFERLSSDRNADGFGLGLPITKGLVALLGGTIGVESEVGHGSTFTVSLPLPVSDIKIEDENPVRENLQALPQQVLVIDNDVLQLEIVKEMLERNGVMCTVCPDVKQLVRELRRKDYDLLLSDIRMAGINGFEVLTLLRNSNIGNSQTIPVIAMTARGDREKAVFIESGFTDCIYKPFSMSELLSLLSGISVKKEEDQRIPDFSALTADVRDKRKLLRMFISQSRQDMEELCSAMNAENIAGLREIAHRMQPAWDLLQSEGLLRDYRRMLKDENPDMDAVGECTERIVEHISMLIAETEKEIKRMSHEA